MLPTLNKMHEAIVNFNQQFKTGVAAAGATSYDVPFNRVVIAGIGGSMIPGELLNMIKLSVKLNRDYDLPPDLAEDTLVVCMSWSGEPEEVVSSYMEARKRNLNVLCITKGGKLGALAEENGTALIKLPQENIQPRTAIGYMTGALFQALGLSSELNFQINPAEMEAEGKILAQSISAKVPIIYTSHRWQQLARFWKILFNENDKVHSFFNTFPSLTHNEIAGFNSKDSNMFHVLFLRDDQDDPRQKRNIDMTIAILKKVGYNYNIVNLSGKTLLEKVLNSYTLALWTSYYLAEFLDVDPEAIEVIEDFKRLKNSTQ